jgi:sporulation protein YlmC with PRC-barrel domain
VHRLNDLIGKPVVSADTGQKLGNVSEVLVDDTRLQLTGLVLGGGMLGKDHVAPFHDVQTLGVDVVVVRTAASVMDGRQWRETGAGASRASSLSGKPVVTASGHRVGTVSDVVVNDTGAFDGIEVGTSAMGGLRTKRSLVRPSAQLKIGPDVIVVPDELPGTGESGSSWDVVRDEQDGPRE